MSRIYWKDELPLIQEQLIKGETIEKIGKIYGVSKQRIYQVMTKFGLKTIIKQKRNFLRDKLPKYYWFNKMLTIKNIEKEKRVALLESFNVPDVCPILGIPLNYDGTAGEGWTRKDDSPSIDRIDSSIGYTEDNIQIISWRANRIKNDSTPEELFKLATYMQNLTKNKLQL